MNSIHYFLILVIGDRDCSIHLACFTIKKMSKSCLLHAWQTQNRSNLYGLHTVHIVCMDRMGATYFTSPLDSRHRRATNSTHTLYYEHSYYTYTIQHTHTAHPVHITRSTHTTHSTHFIFTSLSIHTFRTHHILKHT